MAYNDRNNNRRNDGNNSNYRNDGKPRGDGNYRGDNKPHSDGNYRGDNKTRGDGNYRGDNKPRGDGSYRGDNKPRGDGSYRGDNKPRGDGNYRGDNRPRGDGNYRGDNNPRGDGNYRGDNKPHSDGNYRGDNRPRGDGNYRGDNKPRGDGNYRGDNKPRGDGNYRGDNKPRGDGNYRGDNRPRSDGNYRSSGNYRSEENRGNSGNYHGGRDQSEKRRNTEPENTWVENRAEQLPESDQTLAYFLMGRNLVREAVKRGRSIDKILVVPEQDGSLREIVGLARDRGIIIRDTARAKLDDMCMPFGHNGKPGNHQGIVALVPDVEYVSLQDMLDAARAKAEHPFILLLDGISDPHNLGSMIRSAACAGVHGVVITKRRCASVTAAVGKISAGAVEHVKIARVTNLSAAIDELKAEGLWIAGAEQGTVPMSEADMRGPVALVIGSEGEGLSRLIRERCDYLVSVPIYGEMDSLNASVAAAVLLFEKNRQEGR